MQLCKTTPVLQHSAFPNRIVQTGLANANTSAGGDKTVIYSAKLRKLTIRLAIANLWYFLVE